MMSKIHKDILVAQLLVSLGGATRIMKFAGRKAHKDKGWYFSLEDMGLTLKSAYLYALPGLDAYTDYSASNEPAFILKVYQPRKQLAQLEINKPEGYFWLGV